MSLQEIKVPDIGDFKDVEVIEVLVQAGDEIAVDDPLLTLESDKAAMEVPAPAAGEVAEVKIKVGDKVSEGSLILLLQAEDESATTGDDSPSDPESDSESSVQEEKSADSEPASAPSRAASPVASVPTDPTAYTKIHASPAVRRFARELGVNLAAVTGTARKGRIVRQDVQNYVKAILSRHSQTSGDVAGALPYLPEIDFSQFGPVETQPLSRIQRLSGSHLHRAWLNIPMVTQQHQADVTELENFRAQLKTQYPDVRITSLAFIMRAVAATLQEYLQFNSSLSPDGQHLILKKYIHLGIAVDTPKGLVVPVIRDVAQKSIRQLSKELAEVSQQARAGQLSPKQLQGGCFSISSLGGIGGGAFTPIVNSPEVAILGVARARWLPDWDGQQFQPRQMLPLSLTYDHRVIDGADGARFIVYLAQTLENIRRLLL